MAGTDMSETPIAGLTCDSRQVGPGYLFAALPGVRADGRDFIGQALARGAAAVLAPPGTAIPAADPGPPVPLLIDENPRRQFALMAARFFGRQPERVAAVTGTNGKTSVVHFLRHIWSRLGHRAAALGTLGVIGAEVDIPGGLTTPDPVALHRGLARMADAGIDRLALEASSHGLEQCRLDGVRVGAAAFTNLSRDHLDYHGSMDAYLASKLRLFSQVMAPGGWVVVNGDAPEARAVESVARAAGHRVLSFGVAGRDIRLLEVEALPQGQRLRFTIDGRERVVTLPLLGGFQGANALCALGLALVTGAEEDAAVAALETLEGVPGRLQRIGAGGPGGDVAAYVDYAHTPDALRNMLKALRPHARGRLHVVFGCGGDRDQGKRPEMGRIAGLLADVVIVTDDNPRTEDAAAIRRQIITACPAAREIGDRARAIHAAAAGLRPGDLLVVAGKGHEQGQIIGAETRPFDDAQVLADALAAAPADNVPPAGNAQ